MHYIDLKYDDHYLSDYGFIICNFNSSNNAEEVDIGSNIVFNKITHRNGRKFTLSSYQYDDCVSASFDICKNPDVYSYDQMEITFDECEEIMRWLNRVDFHKAIFYNDYHDKNICYNASFNLQKITINEKHYGFRIIMETDSPHAHGDEIVNTFSCSGTSDIKNIYDLSSEIGYTYPIVEIECRQDGNLSLLNITDNQTTYIKNVTSGEIITIDSFFQTIVTNKQTHKIFDDFNYVFFHIRNDVDRKPTQFSASLSCKITIRYEPVIKGAL